MNKSIEKEIKHLGFAFYRLGLSYRTSGKHRDALKMFNKAIETRSFSKDSQELSSIYFAIALTYRDLNNYQKAISTLKKLVGIAPHFADAYVALSSILIEQSNYKKALMYLRKAAATEPQNAHALKLLGIVYKHLNKYDEALTSFKRYLLIEPSSAFAFDTIGDILFRLDKLKEAENAYRSAIKLRPNNAEYLADLGHVLSLRSKNEEAYELFQKSIELNPKSHLTHHYLADLFFKTARFREARRTYEKSVQISNDCPMAFLQLGRVNLMLDDPGQAILAFDKAIALGTKLADAFYGKSYALHNLGKLKESLFTIKRAIKIEARPLFFGLLAMILADKGDSPGADVAFRHAIKYCDNDHTLYHNYGTFLTRQRKFRNAVNYLQKSIKMDNTCPSVFSDLGWAYLNSNSVGRSIALFQKALRMNDNLIPPVYNLGLASLILGKNRESLNWYSKAIAKDKNRQLLAEAIADLKHFDKVVDQDTGGQLLKYLQSNLRNPKRNK